MEAATVATPRNPREVARDAYSDIRRAVALIAPLATAFEYERADDTDGEVNKLVIGWHLTEATAKALETAFGYASREEPITSAAENALIPVTSDLTALFAMVAMWAENTEAEDAHYDEWMPNVPTSFLQPAMRIPRYELRAAILDYAFRIKESFHTVEPPASWWGEEED